MLHGMKQDTEPVAAWPIDHQVTDRRGNSLARLEERARHDEKHLDMEVDFINRRLAEIDMRFQQAFAAAKEAVIKAEQSTEKRFDSVYEFRGQLTEMVNTLMPRNEANSRFDALRNEVHARSDSLSEKIDRLRERIDKTEGAGRGLHAGWGYLLGGVSLVATISAIVLALGRLSGHAP